VADCPIHPALWAACLASALVAPVAHAQRFAPPGYEVVWVDEFNAGAIDRDTWADFRADLTPWKAGFYSAAAASADLNSGKLILDIYTEPTPDGPRHRSGGLWTAGNLHFRYGFMQARVRFWSEPGMNQAFWLTPSNGTNTCTGTGAEIDVIEHRYHRMPGGVEQILEDDYHLGVHWHGYGSCHRSRGTLVNGTAGQDASDGYHTYAVRWEPGFMEFYWDDRKVHTLRDSNTLISDQPSRVILSHAVFDSLNWAGQIQDDYGPLGTDQRSMMKIDWVRVMQTPGDPRHRVEDLRPGAPVRPRPGSDADMNFDGVTDFYDLLEFLRVHDEDATPVADWNHDGATDEGDIESFLAGMSALVGP
jgi:beta-glucanase (GH16 family)